jgi:hypothetical protein
MRIHLAGVAACMLAIPHSSSRASEGVFAIQGYSDQELLWSDGTQIQSFGALGAVANMLRFQQGDLLVVHSGDWSQGGAGAELWRANLSGLMAAQQAGEPLPWQVIDLVDGENPWDVAAHGSSWWVSLLGAGAVVRVDATGHEELRIDGLDAPEGLALAQGVLAIAESGWGYGNTVRLLDADTGIEQASVTVGANPQSVAVDAEHRLWCLCSGRSWEGVAASLHKLSLSGELLGSWPLAANPAELLLDLGTHSFWLGDEWGSPQIQHGPLANPPAMVELSGVPGSALASRSGDVLIAGAFGSPLQRRSFDGSLLGEAALLPAGAVDLCAVPDPSGLAAPAELRIRFLGGQLHLACGGVLGADGFRLEAAGAGGLWEAVAESIQPRMQLALPPETVRRYRVRALRSW